MTPEELEAKHAEICAQAIEAARYEATLRALLVTTYHDWYADAVKLLLREMKR